MADPMTFTVVGYDTVARTLHVAADDLGDLSKAHAQVAEIIARASQSRAPRLTGALASATAPYSSRWAAGISNPLPYFWPIHSGWPAHNIEAQPFVDEAVDDTEREWLAVYEHAVEQACEEVKGA